LFLMRDIVLKLEREIMIFFFPLINSNFHKLIFCANLRKSEDKKFVVQ
jgi:hypothetical protein